MLQGGAKRNTGQCNAGLQFPFIAQFQHYVLLPVLHERDHRRGSSAVAVSAALAVRTVLFEIV
ncbi:hypothetical protein ACFQU2_13570 [Siccirubricoccus deserti]